MLTRLQHEGIARCRGTWQDEKHLYSVQEYGIRGDLFIEMFSERSASHYCNALLAANTLSTLPGLNVFQAQSVHVLKVHTCHAAHAVSCWYAQMPHGSSKQVMCPQLHLQRHAACGVPIFASLRSPAVKTHAARTLACWMQQAWQQEKREHLAFLCRFPCPQRLVLVTQASKTLHALLHS